jgi:hypothetical protein
MNRDVDDGQSATFRQASGSGSFVQWLSSLQEIECNECLLGDVPNLPRKSYSS